jgi:hypothetical protein
MRMVANRQEVLRQALELTPEDRAALIDDLARSVALSDLTDIDRAWLDEVRDRYAAYQRGEMPLIPGREVFPELDQ